MSDMSAPHERDADDAKPDNGPPTDAVSDEVKADSADHAAPRGGKADPPDAGDPAEPREGPAEPRVDEPTD